jgi:hypothetical protein
MICAMCKLQDRLHHMRLKSLNIRGHIRGEYTYHTHVKIKPHRHILPPPDPAAGLTPTTNTLNGYTLEYSG